LRCDDGIVLESRKMFLIGREEIVGGRNGRKVVWVKKEEMFEEGGGEGLNTGKFFCQVTGVIVRTNEGDASC